MLAAVHPFGGDTSNIRLAEEHFIRQYGVTYEIAYLDCLQKFKERTWQGEIQFVLLFPCHSRFYGFLNSSATVSHKSSIGKPNVPVFCTSQTKSYISDSDYVLRLERLQDGGCRGSATRNGKSVLGRSCDRSPRHMFFSVSLCL